MLLLFDAPLAPDLHFFAAIFLIHPDLGFIALLVRYLLLIAIAIVN